MHTIKNVALGVVLGVLGSQYTGVPRKSHSVMSGSFLNYAVNTAGASLVATFDGAVNSLDWTQQIAGVNGVGIGNDKFHLAVLVDHVEVCGGDVDCDATAPQDISFDCGGAAFEAGQDVDVAITFSGCAVKPVGFATLTLEE